MLSSTAFLPVFFPHAQAHIVYLDCVYALQGEDAIPPCAGGPALSRQLPEQLPGGGQRSLPAHQPLHRGAGR